MSSLIPEFDITRFEETSLSDIDPAFFASSESQPTLLEHVLILVAHVSSQMISISAPETMTPEAAPASLTSRFCRLFVDLLETLLVSDTEPYTQFAMTCLQKYCFHLEDVPLQLHILGLMDRWVLRRGLSVAHWPGLPRVLLFCLGLLDRPHSQLHDHPRLSRLIARLYLSVQVNGVAAVQEKLELVLLENLRRGARDIGGKESLVQKCLRVLAMILRQMDSLSELVAQAPSALGKRVNGEGPRFFYTCSQTMAEIVFIATENAEIQKREQLRERSEEVAGLSRKLWEPVEFEKGQLQRRTQRLEKKAKFRRQMETLAVTDPAKHARIKMKLTQKRRQKRRKRGTWGEAARHAAMPPE